MTGFVLAPFQQDAVDWFLDLPDRRGVIGLPPGSGKSVVAIRIVGDLLDRGGALIVVPFRLLASQWADRAQEAGLPAMVLEPRTAPQLIAARNDAHHGLADDVKVWIATASMLRSPSLEHVVQSMPWSIVVVDEAHRSRAGDGPWTSTPGPLLLLTATPQALPAGTTALPLFNVVDPLVPRVDRAVIEVAPRAEEAEFIEAVQVWEAKASTPIDRVRRSVIVMQCRAGAVLGINAIERVLAHAGSSSGGGIDAQLTDSERKDYNRLLDLAYQIQLPDSRSTRLVEEIVRMDASRAVVIASFVTYLDYLAHLLREAGSNIQVITAAMDRAERDAALNFAVSSGSILLLSDAGLAPSALSGREALVHADLPSDERLLARESLLLDQPGAEGQKFRTMTVTWSTPDRGSTEHVDA
jgi:superfamily II DNA or RNA helicase